MESIESVFDADIKDFELEYLLIKESKEDYLKKASTYKRYSDLYLLYKLRNDEEKASFFQNLIVQ